MLYWKSQRSSMGSNCLHGFQVRTNTRRYHTMNTILAALGSCKFIAFGTLIFRSFGHLSTNGNKLCSHNEDLVHRLKAFMSKSLCQRLQIPPSFTTKYLND
ncbi:hypothetical protein L798_01805 [Zootermopsis nevadensis]|uniref:Uncharacterized protein n=1 Tax=Zootermopsis nevadensis TaxID=136037 RepID=A0A067RR38_ZOONE|nr:hypothetical protein L798_01805 [Zootermopsis nevadensis]